MRLTWRDLAATVLAAAVGLVAVAVVQGWEWPLLGSVRSGSAVLLALGLTACVAGGSGLQTMTMKDPFVGVGMVLGSAALVLAVVAMIGGSEAVFVALAITIGVLWLVATIRHAVEGSSIPARHLVSA